MKVVRELSRSPHWVVCLAEDERGRYVLKAMTPRGHSLGRDLLPALGHLHGHGLVHRDVKPDNIVLDPRGTAHLLDLGAARPLSGGRALTGSGDTLGSPGYLSPEQVRSPAEVDGRSDLFSLGVVLYEVLTKRLPFHAATPTESVCRLLEGTFPPLPREPWGGAVAEWLHRLLETSPDSRFPTAAAALRALPGEAG